MTIYPKHPERPLDYMVDWGGALNGRRVAASDWSIHPAEPGGLDVAARLTGDTTTRATLTGGLAGGTYRVRGRATFADGGSATRGFAVRIGGAG
ncbi:MAG: hypothetical protein ABW173_07835 [Sphingomonas sp.]